jgi:hypothetical protein
MLRFSICNLSFVPRYNSHCNGISQTKSNNFPSRSASYTCNRLSPQITRCTSFFLQKSAFDKHHQNTDWDLWRFWIKLWLFLVLQFQWQFKIGIGISSTFNPKDNRSISPKTSFKISISQSQWKHERILYSLNSTPVSSRLGTWTSINSPRLIPSKPQHADVLQ